MGKSSKRVTCWKLNRSENFRRNIHITFNVNERERITDPILDEKPDIIYYFKYWDENIQKNDQNLEFLEYNTKLIKKILPESTIIEKKVNYIDYVEIAGKLAEIIFSDENIKSRTRITINLLGAKMTSIAIIEAVRTWESLLQEFFDIHIYPRYVYSKNYIPHRKEGAHKGEMICIQFPRHSFELPPKDILFSLYIFEYVRQNDPHGHNRDFVRRKDWEEKLYEYGLLINPDNSSRRNHMDKILIRSMKELNLIKSEKIGGDRNIFLTDNGKKIFNLILIHFGTIIQKFGARIPCWNGEISKSLLETGGNNNDNNIVSDKNTTIEENSTPNTTNVHFVFNRRETDRIIAPIINENPKYIYYFSFKEGSRQDVNLIFKENNIRAIKKRLPECIIIEDKLNYVDYFEVIAEIASILQDLIKKDIPIKCTFNIGTGSKLSSIAIITAFRFWEKILKNNTKIRLSLKYPYMDDYEPFRPNATHLGNLLHSFLPDLEIPPPPEILIKSLFIFDDLLKKNPSKRRNKTILQTEFQIAIFDNKIIKIDENDPKFQNNKSLLRSTQNRKMKKEILDPLRNWGYLTRKKKGRKNRLYLTSDGGSVYKIFELFKTILMQNNS